MSAFLCFTPRFGGDVPPRFGSGVPMSTGVFLVVVVVTVGAALCHAPTRLFFRESLFHPRCTSHIYKDADTGRWTVRREPYRPGGSA